MMEVSTTEDPVIPRPPNVLCLESIYLPQPPAPMTPPPLEPAIPPAPATGFGESVRARL